ncbi:MAG TPA: hypothetical protein VFG33_08780 [Kribbella sp.]|uniref:hypothetical protein n=1 Tax=Kribbella sp. TaxID=1871183 RepID=UPI002D785C6C|nr:hypothetical protein [Kribbella sp.]HET6293456.1 hypothetical protein [Kribbella sp.]
MRSAPLASSRRWRHPRSTFKIAPSTGSVGDSFAENLWSTIKTELIYWLGNTFRHSRRADSAIFRYLDGWYNPHCPFVQGRRCGAQ